MGFKENLVTFIAEGMTELLIIFMNSSKQLIIDIKTYNNKHTDTIIAQHCKRLVLYNNQKTDILRIDLVTRNIKIIEVTICYDLCFQLARNGEI